MTIPNDTLIRNTPNINMTGKPRCEVWYKGAACFIDLNDGLLYNFEDTPLELWLEPDLSDSEDESCNNYSQDLETTLNYECDCENGLKLINGKPICKKCRKC